MSGRVTGVRCAQRTNVNVVRDEIVRIIKFPTTLNWQLVSIGDKCIHAREMKRT